MNEPVVDRFDVCLLIVSMVFLAAICIYVWLQLENFVKAW